MNKRGAYFFVIDAFIAGAIIILSLMVIFNSYKFTRDEEQPLQILEDLVLYMQTTEVRDFQGFYTQNLIRNGTIKDSRKTIFQQVAEFHYSGLNATLAAFLAEISNTAVPPQFGIKFFYDNDTLYERLTIPFADAGLLLSSKKISIITYNSTIAYGPHVAEVWLWTS